MKKCIKYFVVLSLMLCLCGCNNKSNTSNNNQEMYIKPSEFSKETLDVLKIFDNEIMFYDISINESVKSTKISMWTYHDGVWHEEGKIYGGPDLPVDRYAIRLKDKSFELYSINEDGFSKSAYDNLKTEFDKTTSKHGSRLNEKHEIKLNEEVVLWYIIGSNSTSFTLSDNIDFRDYECETGIAITLTVSDKITE